jgi:hypothetical protein
MPQRSLASIHRQRGHGYAGSVTAAVVERIFAEGKTAACLYTDLRNPSSNRCYGKMFLALSKNAPREITGMKAIFMLRYVRSRPKPT